ncbi:hypothetical protein V1509DRAFT_636029 [Lipomyces kononenkoae]
MTLKENDRQQVNMPEIPPIRPQLEPPLVEMFAPQDNWTGISSPTERRRLQNRLNQRAYRRRKFDLSHSVPVRVRRPANPNASCGRYFPGSAAKDGHRLLARFRYQNERRTPAVQLANLTMPPGVLSLRRPIAFCSLNSAEVQEIKNVFEEWARAHYTGSLPTADHLLTLVQFNVFRAMMSNIVALGLSMESLGDDQALSPFSSMNSERVDKSMPPTLCPTLLQRTIPHHPWLDFFPMPTMRDNLLLADGSFDEDQLCHDLLKVPDVSGEMTGLIVWGEPWDPYGWEVTEGFAKKWGWIIKGCREILDSTNYWRGLRGEEELVFDFS